MGLQVWLPLIGDTHNQGCGSYTITTIGTLSWVDGKIGNTAMRAGTGEQVTNGLQLNTNFVDLLNGDYSVAVWVKPYGNHVHYNGSIISSGNWNTANKRWAFGVNQANTQVDVLCNSYNTYLDCAVPVNTWTHLVCTCGQDRKIKLYKNGSYVGIVDRGTNTFDSDASVTCIGRESYANGYFSFNGAIQDLRLYNNCLSEQEIKEISKGLILHFPLNRRGLGPSNLLKNGFGELGSENWDSSTNISTSDIPSGQSDIKASFSNGHAIEHIKLYPTHTYKFSTWIKGTSTSGYTYPSLFPYDVDGKFIYNYNCPDGFNLNTMTTLKQQLKPGDTKIYVNDLSQWNANSGHYYNWAAIFSYTDGTGRTYPDGTYTQNMGRFGSSTNAKTNLDKTNNTITLLSAYTGPTMPVGTKVCASTEGSTYFYPWGGFNLANIQDWTYKESTVSGNHNRLRYSKYVTFWTYSTNRMAGIKIVDLTNEGMDSTTEYDCSGFRNNGTRTGTFTWTSDSPRYQVSTQFDTTSTKVKLPAMSFTGMANSYTFAWWQYNVSTGNMPWGFSDGNRLNCYHTSPLCWNTGDGSSNQFKNGSATIAPSTVQNGWHHMVITGDGTSTKLYIDGEYKGTATTYKALTGTQIYISGWDTGTSYTFNGSKECDFRIYATALSANDVLSLYNNGAYIDSAGNIHGKIR